MGILVKLFDLFNAAAKSLANHVPQNKEDFLAILKQGWDLLVNIKDWATNALGIDIQKIVNAFAAFFVKYFSIAFNFLMELAKKLTERV